MEFNQEQGYLIIPRFITENDAAQMSEHILNSGLLKDDDQCPNSTGYNDASVRDQKLREYGIFLEEYVTKIVGKSLKHVYTYARLYKKGSYLAAHKDKYECEYTFTITLASSNDSESWPIWLKDRDGVDISADINYTDCLLIKGRELEHWRDPVEKDWQLQVFYHFVEEAGEFDSYWREYEEKWSKPQQEFDEIFYWAFEGFLESCICDTIRDTYVLETLQDGGVGVGKGEIDKSIRSVKLLNIPKYDLISSINYAKGLQANEQAWNFNITGTEQTEFLVYNEGDKYNPHEDHNCIVMSPVVRKLTTLTFLNDNYKGGKFFIMPYHGADKVYPPQTKGTTVVFDSTLVHGCEPVEEGTRYAVVTWLLGNRV